MIIEIIPQWKILWKFYSTHALLLASITPIALDEASKVLGTDFPLWVKCVVAGFIFVSGLVGRTIVQVKSSDQENENVVDTGQSN